MEKWKKRTSVNLSTVKYSDEGCAVLHNTIFYNLKRAYKKWTTQDVLRYRRYSMNEMNIYKMWFRWSHRPHIQVVKFFFLIKLLIFLCLIF